MSNKDFNDKSVPYRYVGVEMSVCPQCGRNMSSFSAKHFGICNGCKDRNEKKMTGLIFERKFSTDHKKE